MRPAANVSKNNISREDSSIQNQETPVDPETTRSPTESRVDVTLRKPVQKGSTKPMLRNSQRSLPVSVKMSPSTVSCVDGTTIKSSSAYFGSYLQKAQLAGKEAPSATIGRFGDSATSFKGGTVTSKRNVFKNGVSQYKQQQTLYKQARLLRVIKPQFLLSSRV